MRIDVNYDQKKKKKAIEKEVFALSFFGHGPAEPSSVLLLSTEESPWAVEHLEVSCQTNNLSVVKLFALQGLITREDRTTSDSTAKGNWHRGKCDRFNLREHVVQCTASVLSDQCNFNSVSTMDPINGRETLQANVDLRLRLNPERQSIKSVLRLRWMMESRVKDGDNCLRLRC